MALLTETLVKKMGFVDEAKIVEKTTELIRLLELRSINVNFMLNDYAKIVLCIDLAATLLGVSFDQKNALKLSGLRKGQYANNKRMFEKLLDINKIIGVNEVCIKLGMNEVAQKAVEYLELYKSVVGSKANDIDMTHPQYAAMSVHQACKSTNKRISKAKILAISHLRPSQWTQLEQHWDKIINNNFLKISEKVKHLKNDKQENKIETQGSSTTITKTVKIKDYEMWKSRMLAMADLQLSSKDNKENC